MGVWDISSILQVALSDFIPLWLGHVSAFEKIIFQITYWVFFPPLIKSTVVRSFPIALDKNTCEFAVLCI